MRILYVGSFRLPCHDAAAARVLNIARALRASGNSVQFLSWGGKMEVEDLNEDGIYRVDGFPYIVTNEIDFKGSLWNRVKGKLRQGNTTKKLLKSRISQYDAIITYNCSLIRWLIPFCKKNNKFLISDVTEWYDYSELKLFERPGYFGEMHFWQKRIRNKILISSFLNNYYKESNNVVIPATCDYSEPKWHKTADAIEDFDGITLIYAGNPAKKDAVHYVIKAVDRLAREDYPIRFLILGITKENYIKRYSYLLLEGEMHENIVFLGRVSQNDVPSYYGKADFMVLLRESTRKSNAGFPTKFAESFTSGTPVIANLTSDLGLYLLDGQTGLVVDSSNEEAIYKTLKEKALCLTKEDIAKMKDNVKKVSKSLDYHSYVEKLDGFMNNLQ